MRRTTLGLACVLIVGAAVVAAAWSQPERPGVTRLYAEESRVGVAPATSARSVLSLPDGSGLTVWYGGQTSRISSDLSVLGTQSTQLVVANSPHAVDRDRRGRLFAATRPTRGRIFSEDGSELRSFPIPISDSVATLPNGDIAVASPTVTGLMHVYSTFGAQRAHIGRLQALSNDPEQNRFLNHGIVLAGPENQLIYVYTNSPNPMVERFSVDGEPITGFAIEGASIAGHLEETRAYLASRATGDVGGFKNVSAAAFDKTDGTLLVATVARHPGWESVYEFSLEGEKLAEYSFFSSDRAEIDRIVDMAVQDRRVVIVDDRGNLHAFSLPRKARRAVANRLQAALGWVRSASSGVYAVALAKQACPPYITVTDCSTGACTVGGNSRDCKASMCSQANCNVATSQTCQHSAAQCTIALATCVNGVSTNHGNLVMQCPADVDGDGYTPEDGSDCDDTNPNMNPGVHIGQCGQYGNEDTNCNGIEDAMECQTPIAIDVRDDGFSFTSRADGVRFDLFGDGNMKQLPWTAGESDDAWLAMDRNGNGIVDSGKELWGAPTDQPPSHSRNGYIALAEYDRAVNGGNEDEIIDRRDGVFDKLLLWTDTNHDGISQRRELTPLAVSSIESIDLNYREYQDRDKFGNWFRYKAPANVGQPRAMIRTTCDVYLWAQ